MASLYRKAIPAAARRTITAPASSTGQGAAPALAIQGWFRRRSVVAKHVTAGEVGMRRTAPWHAGILARQHGTFRSSAPRLEEHVMNLPGLGDSISEGTVVEWRKSVGDEVEEDEVIAIVETDKVSVDVRSTHVGVVVKLFAAVDDVIEVGKPLCTIDGDEASAVKAKIAAAQEEEDANAPPPEVKKPNIEDAYAGAFMAGADFVPPKKNKHEPLIKFLGKRSRVKQQDAQTQPAAPTRHRHSPGALDFEQIVGGAMFGRPLMSEEEMDAVNSGGAEIAPQLRYIDGSRWAS